MRPALRCGRCSYRTSRPARPLASGEGPMQERRGHRREPVPWAWHRCRGLIAYAPGETSMSIEIIPTGAALGAEIRGVDLAQPLDDATFAAIERAYTAHGVMFFRDQRITPPQQVAFTRRFGEIEFNVFGERWSVPGQPGDRGGFQRHRGRPSDRRSSRRRELAQRHVLHGAAAARDDAVRDRSPRSVRPDPGRYRVRQRRRGVGCLARASQGVDRRAARHVRLPWPQAGLPADPGGDRPLSRPFSIRSSGRTPRPDASACT